jgi:hypothetical protein
MLLKAGQLEVTYQNGFLRYFSIGGKEVLRMIYFAVRDRDWNTIPGFITHENIKQSDNTFCIVYQYEVKDKEIQMQWDVAISGLPDSTITFDIRGKVLHTFLKNRLGFCVLHPVEGIAGKACQIEHSNGNTTQSFFPAFISPYQPFKDIRSMHWQAGDGATLQLEFEGDIFETEDHRNWTDASYKTYCTPLDMPFPVEVNAGTEIHQRCTLRVLDAVTESVIAGHDTHITIQITRRTLLFPKIGIGMNPEAKELKKEEIHFLKRIGFSHLRTNIFLTKANWHHHLQKAVQQSKVLNITLELALFFGDNPLGEVLELLALLSTLSAPVTQLMLFDAATKLTSTALLKKALPAIRLALPNCRIGGGSDANFAEVNRNKFDYGLVDFVCYSINPQVHATDDLTLIENMSAQADTVLSAKKLSYGKPVHVSPVTLKPRFNAVAISESANSMPPADNRQTTDFICGWTLGSLKYLSEAGGSSITYFETTGSRGICTESEVYPMGKLFEYILNLNPLRIRISTSPHPLKVTSLVLESESGSVLLMANHTDKKQVVQLPVSNEITKIVSITKSTNQLAVIQSNSFLLPAFDVVSVDFRVKANG